MAVKAAGSSFIITVDIERGVKETPKPAEEFNAFQKRVIRELNQAEYALFHTEVEKHLLHRDFKKVNSLIRKHSSEYFLPMNYLKTFDLMLERGLENTKDDHRIERALVLIKSLSKHHLKTQFMQLCEIACLYKKNDKSADIHLKELSQYACKQSYSSFLKERLKSYEDYRREELFALFTPLSAKLAGIRQQVLETPKRVPIISQ